jgi:uncharacterized protein (TIGR00255 family)
MSTPLFLFQVGLFMLYSMTGFGSAEIVSHGFQLGWQLKSVNHRFLDLSLRLPDSYGELEILAAKRMKSLFGRGRIELTLSLKRHASVGEESELNSELLQSLLSLEKSLNEQAPGERIPLGLATLLNWPGMVQERSRPQLSDSEDGKSFSEVVLDLLEGAAHELTQSRLDEGEELGSIIGQQLSQLTRLVERVEENLPRVQVALEQRLKSRLSELAETAIDEARLAQEQIYFMNRLDVAEELVRLKIHLKDLAAVLKLEEPVGRRLDFICQELNREANTLCSKAQDGEITRIGVDMKVLIEKLREQVQNLE